MNICGGHCVRLSVSGCTRIGTFAGMNFVGLSSFGEISISPSYYHKQHSFKTLKLLIAAGLKNSAGRFQIGKVP